MAEEPTLPRLPAVSWDSGTQTFGNARKRLRGDGAPTGSPLFFNSSDPAVFSSDDDPNLENYTEGRHRKKRYVGSWFQQQPASGDSAFSEDVRPKPKGKRTFQRQIDSGVWMGSDASTDLDDAIAEIGQSVNSRLPQLNVAAPAVQPLSAAEKEARQMITRIVDEGVEDVDLTGLGLAHVSNETIEPLAGLSCIPLVDEDVPFEHKDPALKLYLANNPLARAPGALFNLEFLSVLSLRNTKISELPPAIGNLRNLTTLNVSLNQLRYLPAELLELISHRGKLRSLHLMPNPFHEPMGFSPLDDVTQVEDRVTPPSTESEPLEWQARISGRSPVQFSDSHGAVVSQFRIASPPADDDHSAPLLVEMDDLASAPSLPRSSRGSNLSIAEPSRVPSLMELALQSCSRTGLRRSVLPSLLAAGGHSHLAELTQHIIDQGEANANAGSVPCSTCGRHIIMPLAQWMEWWALSPPNTGKGGVNHMAREGIMARVPFLKRACSSRCLPKPMVRGTVHNRSRT